MSAFQPLAPRPPAGLEAVHDILGSLVARYRQEEVLTAMRQIPAREAKFRPIPTWVTSALAEAYRTKGVRDLYSHQAATAELVRNGKNVVVVTPTASGKTLCYNLPVLNSVFESHLARRLDDSFGVFTYDGDTPSDARKAIRERGHIVLTALWSPSVPLSGLQSKSTPAVAVFQGVMHLVRNDPQQNNALIWSTSSDGLNWSADQLLGPSTQSGASLAAFESTLHMVYLEDGSNVIRWWTSMWRKRWGRRT